MMEKAEESGTNAYGSKIRITDALLRDQVENSRTLFEEPVVLPELGEPQNRVRLSFIQILLTVQRKIRGK